MGNITTGSMQLNPTLRNNQNSEFAGAKTRGHKAMLHKAIFPATCNATMTNENHCKLQRGYHTLAIFLCNLQRALATRIQSDWLISTRLRYKLYLILSHAAVCLLFWKSQRKSLLHCRLQKMGCHTWKFFSRVCNATLQVASCRKTCLV